MATWKTQRSVDGGVDEIPLPAVGGRLWLCGKHAIGPDVDALLARTDPGATVVCLNERHELLHRYPDYVAWLESSAQARWHPIPDLHAPPLVEANVLVDRLAEHVTAGGALVVHCGAGIGRAGTIAACLLVRLGAGVDEALATVAAHRPMAGPEVGAQTDLVGAFASE